MEKCGDELIWRLKSIFLWGNECSEVSAKIIDRVSPEDAVPVTASAVPAAIVPPFTSLIKNIYIPPLPQIKKKSKRLRESLWF